LWPYSASDNVNRARNSQPGKMAVNLNMQFVDFWWRFATVPRHEIELRSWQSMAHGGALTFEVNGTLDLQDRQALAAVKPIFQWAADNEQYYAGQASAARVLLLGAPAETGRASSEEPYRGMFRLLSEEHIPFAVSDNLDWLGKRDYDVVIATNWAPAELRRYAENGGKVLIAGAAKPECSLVTVERTEADVKGYIRVRDHAVFPSLKETDLLLLDGPFTSVKTTGPHALTLIPPSMIGPPEFVHIDIKDTDTPAIVTESIGKGEVVWIPWNLGGLYYRHSLPAHAGLFRDVFDRLQPRRQLQTDAHPLVEMSLMRQSGRMLLHLINVSGHSGTGYFAPVAMSEIRIRVAGSFHSAKTIRSPGVLAVRAVEGYSEFTLPKLSDYELVVLE
jgi:hypothetical protein